MTELSMSQVACLIVDYAKFQENVVAMTSKVRRFLSEFDRGAAWRIRYSVESWLWSLRDHAKKKNTFW